MDNTSSLDQRVQALRETLHAIEKVNKAGTLTEVAFDEEWRKLARFYQRDAGPCIEDMSLAELLSNYWQYTLKQKQSASPGFQKLTAALNGGFQGQRLSVLLGTPGSGKTSLANQWSYNIAHKQPVLYVTSEDNPAVLLAKTISRIGSIHYSAVLHGWDDVKSDINNTIAKLLTEEPSSLLRYVDATSAPVTVNNIRDLATAHFADKEGPGVIVVDYLQRMARANRDTRDLREAVSSLTEQLRALACDLDCAVLAIASMNRASYEKTDGAMASAKESGDIEYTADVLLSLAQPVATTTNGKGKELSGSGALSAETTRILRIDKNRQGEHSNYAIPLKWLKNYQSFEEEV